MATELDKARETDPSLDLSVLGFGDYNMKRL